MEKSIAIVQTSAVSSATLKNLCTEIMPEVMVYQIIDDSLIQEVNAHGGPTAGVKRRLYSYYQAAASLGVDLILNQCSSVGEVAESLQPFIDIPIIRVDEAMARKAVSLGKKIAVIATVQSTVGPSVRLVEREAKKAGTDVCISPFLVDGAMMLLIEKGDVEAHNKMVIGAVEKAAEDHDVVVLAQGSMVVLEPLLSGIRKPVLLSPGLGVEYVREVLYR
jgi:Asp/Glu/hydantoin racemase